MPAKNPPMKNPWNYENMTSQRWHNSRLGTLPTWHDIGWYKSRLGTLPAWHGIGWYQFRIGTRPAWQGIGCYQSRLDTPPTYQGLKWHKSRLGTLPTSHCLSYIRRSQLGLPRTQHFQASVGISLDLSPWTCHQLASQTWHFSDSAWHRLGYGKRNGTNHFYYV